MALKFYTGFDWYDDTQKTRVWSYASNGTSLVPGRFGGRGWYFDDESGYLSKYMTASTTTVVGMAFSFSFGDATNPFLIFEDATTSRTNPITQIDVRLTNDGAFQVTRNGDVLGTTGAYLVEFDHWNYLEVKAFINSTTGYIILRLNGQVFLNITGLNTQTSGNNYVNMVRFQPFTTTGSYNFKLDDIYILDDTGPAPHNDFLGECRVQTQWPTANGEKNDFEPIGAATNYQAVDEIISDDDVTYVRNGVVGNIDDYVMGTVNLTGTIYGVQLNLTYKKDDVGTRTITPTIKSGGSYYEGALFVCQSDYAVAQKIWELEPHDLAAWTNTSVNAINAGIKIKA